MILKIHVPPLARWKKVRKVKGKTRLIGLIGRAGTTHFIYYFS